MSITIKIGGSTVTGLSWQDLTIEDVFAPTGDVCSISGVWGNESPSQMPRLPQVSQELQVIFSDDTHTETIFAGPITEVSLELNGSGDHPIQVSAEDFTKRMDSKLVSGVYTESTTEDMVVAILADYAPNINTSYVSAAISAGATTTILPKTFDWKRPSECLQEIAEEKQYVWWIDYTGHLYFIPSAHVDNKAPISTIVPKTETRIGAFRFTTSMAELKNTILIKDFMYRSPSFYYQPGETANAASGWESIGGKVQPTVNLTYEPTALETTSLWVTENDGGDWSAYILRYDLTERDPGTTGPLAPQAGCAYLNFSTKKVTIFRSAGIDTAFPATSYVQLKYYPLLSPAIPEVHLDVASISSMQERESGTVTGDGEYQYMLNFGSLEFGGTDPIGTLGAYVKSLIDKYAWPKVTGSFTVYYDGSDNLTYGWRAGQTFNLQQIEWNLYDQRAYYQEWKIDPEENPLICWINRVRTTVINPTTLKYEVEWSSVLGG